MRGLERTLPPAFSLLQSEFNNFLYAPIGEESNDSVLTVLSAFARLGIDPWQESARLAQLSKVMATQRMTSIVAGLPNGRWAQSDAGAIAARLIELLPAKRVAPSPSGTTADAQHPWGRPIATFAFVIMLGGTILLAVINHMNQAPLVGPDSTFSTTDSFPSAPLGGSRRH